MATRRGPKPRVEYDGRVYSCKRYKVEIPDLQAMSRVEALQWLCRETTPTGWSKAPSPLRGMGGAISLVVK